MPESAPDAILLAEERIAVAKREVETGRVRVRTETDEKQALVRETLVREEARVERVAVGREVDTPPEPHWEGETLVIPLVEEVVVVSKRWRVTEELRIAKARVEEQVEAPVTVRSQRAVVERTGPEGTTSSSPN